MRPSTSPYRCRLCGALSYRRLVHRGADGNMVYSGIYRCSGCSLTFTDPSTWREASDTADTTSAAAGTLAGVAQPSDLNAAGANLPTSNGG